MTTAYSTLMGLALPVQGELSGTWGDTVNKGITDYVDIALAGTQTISGSQTAVTLSLTNGDASATNIAQAGSGATGTAQFAIINCTGNPAGLLTVTVPASSRQYVVINATSTSQSVKIVGAGPTTGVTIVSGEKAHIAWNGSDYVKVASSLVSQLSGTLGVANGGTGGTTQSAARTGLGATTLGANLFTITNPSAVTFPRFNADNTVSALNAADFRTAIGAGTGTGDVVGPASATDSALVAFNGTTGKLIKQAATVTVAQGGTGQTTYTNGQLLIGNSTGNTLTKATLTAGSGVSITNGAGSITISATGTGGDVVGPASSTDNAIARFDGTTGKLIQDSAVTIADTTGDITGGKYNKVTITAPATGSTLTIADGKTLTANNSLTLAGTDGTTMTFPSASASVGYLNIPAVADKTSAYILATGDVGKVVGVGTGGSIEIPNSTFAAGDAVLIFNNTSAGITITCTITTAYIAGTDADKATVTLATRGLANILFISGTACVITGNVS